MKVLIHLASMFTLFCAFLSCHNESLKRDGTASVNHCTLPLDSIYEGSDINLKYAKQFSAKQYKWGFVITFKNGNSDSTSVPTLFLVRTQLDEKEKTDVNQSILHRYARSTIVEIPLRRLAINSTTHIEFLRLLNETNKLCGLCNADYVYSDDINQKVKSGEITQLGNSMQVNAEQLLLCAPDLLILSDPRETPSAQYCPTTLCQEWKESSALGRAEWIKFEALLFDKLQQADSIFNKTEERYKEFFFKAALSSYHPSVFAAGNFGDTWYLTGGKGFMASIYRDANVHYLLADTMVGTVTCGMEWLLSHYRNADYWMNCQSTRLSELDPRLKTLKSYQTREIYHFNKRSVKRGSAYVSDFYESAVAHPDIVLADLVHIFHPQFLPDHKNVYVGKIED